jgi:hypothetical protein
MAEFSLNRRVLSTATELFYWLLVACVKRTLRFGSEDISLLPTQLFDYNALVHLSKIQALLNPTLSQFLVSKFQNAFLPYFSYLKKIQKVLGGTKCLLFFDTTRTEQKKKILRGEHKHTKSKVIS